MMSDADAQEALVLRDISARDASACATLSRAVGWPYRSEDWEMAIGLGRGVVATLSAEIIATALWWPYGETHATLGMIIVSPDHQGAGIGKRLMQGLFEQTKARSLMLNATAAGEPLYGRCGFVRCGAVSQYHGDALAVAAPILEPGAALRPGAATDQVELERLDREASGLPRRAVLTALLERGECVILERDGKAIGFSILRRFGRGLVVGPVVAPDEADARALIAHWLHGRQGQFVRVDIPIGSNLGDWLVESGLRPAGTVTAMVRGERPVGTGSARLYALINQALG
jgi:GNAT superfamily N-acetyltransferase